ncbi:MAG: hypothetical protein IJC78_07330 [Clostridia bacterium]|nr:hypothetical protein [Clostridia bacterium]
MKKILAAFLSLAMLLSACMALPAFAEDATEETVENPVISATKETYIELENYADGSTIKIKQWASAHGGAYASNTGSGDSTQTLTVPVTVEKAGAYMLEYVGSNAGWLSYGTICVNDVAVISIQQTKGNVVSMDPAEGTYFDPYSETTNNFPAFKYTIPVALSAGTQTFTVNHYVRSASGVAFAADYIKLTPVVSDTVVSGTEETYLEMENFAAYAPFGSAKTDDRMHGSSYLNIDWYATEGCVQPATSFVVPFHAEKAGYYDIEVRMNKLGNSYVSKNVVSIDDYTLFTNNANDYTGTDISEGNTFIDNNWPMFSYSTRIYLAEGEHMVHFLLHKAVSQDLITIKADCVKFTPAEGYTLSAEEPTTVEAEALMHKGETPRKAILVEGEEKASGNAYIYTLSAGTKDTKYHIPFTVEKAGIYQFETVQALAGYMSAVEFYLDGSDTPLDNVNVSALADQPFNVDANINTIAKLCRAELYLPAGEHGLTVVYKIRESTYGGSTAYASDYFRFTFLAEEEAVVNTVDKTVSIRACYEDPVANTILIALYSGKEMVGVKLVDQIDVTVLNDTVSYIGDTAPDTAKVFLWDTLDNITPLQGAKVITVK